jgi:hypothetical protein
MSPEHAEHYREWRHLIEEHVREFYGPEPDADAEIKAEEARLAEHIRMVDDLARILATPAQTWGDVLLYAQVCSWANCAGTDPEGPDAAEAMASGLNSQGRLCDLSLVKLIEAVSSVGGIGRSRP